MSYNTVVSQLAPGGTYEGWGYADGLQVQSLIANTGLTISPNVTESQYDALISFITVWGGPTYTEDVTHTSDDRIIARVSDAAGAGFRQVDIIAATRYKTQIRWDTEYVRYNGAIADHDPGATGLGSFLIRDTIEAPAVPEPATIALLGIGLVGLAGAEVRRRRKKKTVDKS